MSVQKLILNTEKPFQNAKKYIPFYMFAVGFMIAMVTLLKGLKHLGIELDLGLGSKFANALPVAAVIGVIVAMIGKGLLNKVKEEFIPKDGSRFDNVERVFAILMIFTACAMAFAQGSNDVANAVGPLAAVAM